MTTHSTTMHELLSSDDWLSSPSPGSVPGSVAPPLSPSPVTQQQPQQPAPSFNNTAMSNGYSSPMSNGSYDPYSPNGKQGKQNTHSHPSSSATRTQMDGIATYSRDECATPIIGSIVLVRCSFAPEVQRSYTSTSTAPFGAFAGRAL